MLDKMIRALVFLDDLAELVVVGLARKVRARWRPLVAIAVAGGCALAWQPKPAPPVIAPAFAVEEIREIVPGKPAALIKYGHHPLMVVNVGDVLPDARHPELVIASIDRLGVNAVRIGEKSVLRRLARTPLVKPPTPERVALNAIAGEYPGYVAVIEHERETYIVQHGTKVPESGPTKLTITKLSSTSLEYWDHELQRRFALAIEQGPPTAAELVPPTNDGLDLEGI